MLGVRKEIPYVSSQEGGELDYSLKNWSFQKLGKIFDFFEMSKTISDESTIKEMTNAEITSAITKLTERVNQLEEENKKLKEQNEFQN